MRTVDVFGYKIHIGTGLLGRIGEIVDLAGYSRVVVITDTNIPMEYLNQFEKITVAPGEQNKNLKTVEAIWKKMIGLGVDRKTLVINLGGGVIGDMGGFAASSYMRGVPFIQAPTTLLASVDASVGGKVGIDFEGIKNLIGSFNQPEAVIIDISVLKSLPDREFISGFGEIIKHGLIYDAEYFHKVTSKNPGEFSQEEIEEMIARSCEIKSEIISSDEKESGSRKLLNFGHTIGHAIESSSFEISMPLLHGEAVSIGMVAEAKISVLLGLIEGADLERIETVLRYAGLPVRVRIEDKDKIKELIAKDKKSEKGEVNWTLLEKIGSGVINKKVNPEILNQALEHISE